MLFSIGLSISYQVKFSLLWVCLSEHSLFLIGLDSKEISSGADSNLC